jgi:trimeric autotransporter adhesin
MKKFKSLVSFLGLSLVIAVMLPACSSETAAPPAASSTTAPATPAATGPLVLQSIEASPSSIDVPYKSKRQLEITAVYTNFTRQDVTAKCTYKSDNEGLATVDAAGLVSVSGGEATCHITVSYTENGVTKTISVKVSS